MKLLDPDLTSFGWRKKGNEEHAWMDQDGFNSIYALGTEDGMSGTLVATLFFAAVPVLVVYRDDLGRMTYEQPTFVDELAVQNQAAFLESIGEADEGYIVFLVENGFNTNTDGADEFLVGDGHELVALAGRLEEALKEMDAAEEAEA